MLMAAVLLPLQVQMQQLVPDRHCHSEDDHENGRRDDDERGGDRNEHHDWYCLLTVLLSPTPVRHAHRLAGSKTDGDHGVSRVWCVAFGE